MCSLYATADDTRAKSSVMRVCDQIALLHQIPAESAMVEKEVPPSDAREKIRVLEQEVRAEGVQKANNIVTLISHVKAGAPNCEKAIHATRRTLVRLEKPAELEEQLRKWLRKRRLDYARALIDVAESKDGTDEELEAATAAAALTHKAVWKKFVTSMIGRGLQGRVAEITESFVTRFGDLRLEVLTLIHDRIGDLDTRLRILSWCATPVEAKAARSSEEKIGEKDLRKAFGAAWVVTVEDRELQPKHRRDILERVPKELIPNMSDPLKLADFLSDSYNNGDDVSVAVSALDGLFVLIAQHGLDYPLFYQKLYALMSPKALFYADGRKRFLELVAAFLRQGAMLPGGLVAAFIKRLVRRALVAPTEGALWCLRLALDLLYKHPNVSFLVHRGVNLFDKEQETVQEGLKRPRSKELDDPYDDDELDPQASNADSSSLWELEVLSKHLSPAVSRLVLGFSKDVRTRPPPPPGDLADYTDLSFSDAFQAEFKRRAKSYHLAYDKPGSSAKLKELEKKLSACIEWS